MFSDLMDTSFIDITMNSTRWAGASIFHFSDHA